MTDTPVQKGFWKAIRAALRWVAHLCLIPVVLLLTVLSSGFTKAAVELTKLAADVGSI